jgi:hypothetical protein
MTPFRLVALLLILLIQSPVATQEKQAARNRLKEMNVAFTTDAFIQSIIEGDKPRVELFLGAGMSPNTALGRLSNTGPSLEVQREVPARVIIYLTNHPNRIMFGGCAAWLRVIKVN